MATESSSNSVAIVAIVILLIAALFGGYMFFGPSNHRGDGNDIHIDMPDGKKK